MADKEVTAFIVDVDKSMDIKQGGRDITDLECGLRYVKDVVASKIIKGRKTDLVHLVTVNGEETDNDAKLKHVAVSDGFKQPFYHNIKDYDLHPPSKSIPEDDKDGIIRALLLTIQNMNAFVKKLKYKKNIVIVTNSLSTPELDEEYSNAIVDLVLQGNFNLVIIGVDFYDETENDEYQVNRKCWRDLVKRIPGSTLMSGGEANDLVDYPMPKTVRPVKTFSGEFRIGANPIDPSFVPSEDISCICFSVDGYPATKIDKPPSKKTYALNKYDEPEPISISTEYEVRMYTDDFDNENEMHNANEEELQSRPFTAQQVEKESMAKGYRYGKSTVVLPPALEEKRKYATKPGIDLRGIIPQDSLPRGYLTSESTLLLGTKSSDGDTRGLAVVVDSLKDLEAYAIARYVPKPNAEVQMVVLIPVYIDKNSGLSNKRRADDEDLTEIRGLILNRLPFFEDEKLAVFPPLTEIHTTSGKVIKEGHKYLPSKDVQQAMDSLVDNMDLDMGDQETDFDADRRIFNPLTSTSLLPLPTPLGNHDNLVKRSTGIHRTNLALKDIAIKGATYKGGLRAYVEQDGIVPPLSQKLASDTVPSPLLLKRVKKDLKRLTKLLDIKYIEKDKKKSKDKYDEIHAKDEEEDDISLEELLSRGVRA